MMTSYLRRAYSSFVSHVFDVPARLLAFLLLLCLLIVPITKPGFTIMLLLTSANTMAIFAASWDLLVGRTGQMSLGHALFFGLGAYVTALLSVYLNLPLWMTIPLSVLIGFLAAFLIGFPCLRIKGPYLALVTIVFPIVFVVLIFYFKGITGGERGIFPLARFFPFLGYFEQQTAEYYLTLLLLLGSGIILYKIASSKTGMIFVSILDDELASKACGINVTKYKLLAFAISGGFASLAGSVYAHLIRVANPLTLTLTTSFMPVILTLLGGLGTIYGPIAGAYILQFIDRYVLTKVIDIPAEWHMIIYASFIILLVIKWPRGVARFVVEDVLEELEEAREIEERGRHIWKRYKKKDKGSLIDGD